MPVPTHLSKKRIIVGIFLILIGAPLWSQTNFTFFGVSDPHYGILPGNPLYSEQQQVNRGRMPGLINIMPGRAYPASIGGVVDTPRGILLTGDLIHYNDSASWKQYTEDFGVFGDKKVAFPTFEALGNHDFHVFEPDTFWIMKHMLQRNQQRLPELSNIDSLGLHYSWDWEGVHFINMNTYAGDLRRDSLNFYPMHALDFLRKDLETQVGHSGRPVFIMQHIGLRLEDGFPDYTDFPQFRRNKLSEVIHGYNIVGILHGHSHREAIYKWMSGNDTIDVFDLGTLMDGDLMVFRITEGYMSVILWSPIGWKENVMFQKTFSMGNPPTTSVRYKKPLRRDVPFSVPGSGTLQTLPASVKRLEIINMQGRCIRTLMLNRDRLPWDGRDASGFRAPPGLYVFREKGKRKALGKLLLN